MSVVMEAEYSWTPDKMVEVVLSEPDDFLKVRETLTRIGVASRKEKKLLFDAFDHQMVFRVRILHRRARIVLEHSYV